MRCPLRCRRRLRCGLRCRRRRCRRLRRRRGLGRRRRGQGFAVGAAAGAGGGRPPFTSVSPSSSRMAIGSFTFTPSVPSATRILPSTPSSTASTSIVALSVSISAITSPASTVVAFLLEPAWRACPRSWSATAPASGCWSPWAAPRSAIRLRARPRRHSRLRQRQLLQIGRIGQRHIERRARASSGASSQSNACSITCMASSAPMPANGQPSSTETRRLVFFTLSTIVSVSNGRSERRLITSASMPCFGQRLGRLQRHADHDAEGDDGDVACPARSILALPIGRMKSSIRRAHRRCWP